MNDTLILEIKETFIFLPDKNQNMEDEIARINFFNNLKKLLIDAISLPTVSNSIFYINVLIGESKNYSIDFSISLLRTLSRNQKKLVNQSVKIVTNFLYQQEIDQEVQKKADDAIYMLKWLIMEEYFYDDLNNHFKSPGTISSEKVLDKNSLEFSRESDQDINWLAHNVSEIHWYDLQTETLNSILESRNYYLLSPIAYKFLIPAVIRNIKGLLSAATNGNFYINLIELYDLIYYLNPVSDYKLELLTQEEKNYVGAFMLMIKILFNIIGNEEGVDDLMASKYWNSYLSNNK
ncbi:hypothetical protein [Neisseria zalophi]|uniref:Uncharacterized protein n=1 Tax=Neisseria zalophi TaxID=640030 RepID=A0A5J6PU67_9NEIS|nr:hypothetical protein [Neisseria zalophi]QEY26199.1 hypothetical protein D0T92_06465 [Neisseria zalophi]